MRNAVIGIGVLYIATWMLALPLAASPALILAVCLAPPLIWLSAVDLVRMIIPDTAVLAIAAIGLGFAAWADPGDLVLRIASAVTVLLGFWLAGEVYFRRKGREGLGIGDAKLLGALTLTTGAGALWLVIFLGAVGGIAAVILARILRRGATQMGVPFGPFLAYAYFVTLLIFVEI